VTIGILFSTGVDCLCGKGFAQLAARSGSGVHHVAMTVRFLRTAASMAFPDGRLLAVRGGQVYLLAADGWTRLGAPRTRSAEGLSREDAEDWCEREGWDLHLLDAVPE
jgi:hypothetical protein